MTAMTGCYGIISRLLGDEYCSWFLFEEIPEKTDYYRISASDGKILIQGNNGVCMAAGLQFYLKNYCNVYIGQQTIQNKMPSQPCIPEKTIYRKAFSKIRYAYNYCTLSYSMPFWDRQRWQRELDWLALSGVNLVLDFTGVEEVWYRFLKELGYEENEIQKWIVGPCYTAWQQMQNIEEIGGPVPRQFFSDRAELARENQAWMADMGMIPVRQGYGGMVPSWHKEHAPELELYPQGIWNGISRPAMLDTDSDAYKEYARKFYQIQDEVLGEKSHYYAADVFHEGGIRPEELKDDRIAECVLQEMLKHDPESVWIIQAWHDNPTGELLEGICRVGKEHALILDLSATDNPAWVKNEFMQVPWVYCMLDMYGGRVSTHGEPEVLADMIPEARKKASQMVGVGLTAEATLHNPLVMDLLFEMAWEEEPVDLETWISDWLKARYGCLPDSALTAWKQLLQTAYHSPGYSHHGGYTQIFTFRPRMEMTYGEVFNELNTSIIKKPYYDRKRFEEAVLLLGQSLDILGENESWQYDMQDLLRQVLNNRGTELALSAVEAWKAGEEKEFKEKVDKFFQLFDTCDRLMYIRQDTRLSDWLGYAAHAGEPYGEATKQLFVKDAKRLITTWGYEKSYESLADYAYRQYGGLLQQYYRPRWERFFERMESIPVEEWYQLAQEFVEEDYNKENIESKTPEAVQVIKDTLQVLQN
ncbi:MAG: alpha-N-acetylglucosaminidase [Oliverpabstia sp.]